MTWRVDWTEPAQLSLQRMPWLDAARVDRAVMTFAATSRGDVHRLPNDDAVTVRLRAGRYRARLSLDPLDRVLTVWMVYRFDR